jgi:ferredoxin
VEADDRHRRQVDWAARGCPEQAIRVLTTSTP